MSNYHDTSNSISVILKNHRQEIELSVKGYEVSVPIKSYWDNNWLIFSCRLREDNRSMYGEFPCFMTMELQRLKMLLEQYQSGGLPAVSWNGTEPNFAVYLYPDFRLKIYFDAEADGWEMTFQKNAEPGDVEKLIGFCSDSLKQYPVRDIGIK